MWVIFVNMDLGLGDVDEHSVQCGLYFTLGEPIYSSNTPFILILLGI